MKQILAALFILVVISSQIAFAQNNTEINTVINTVNSSPSNSSTNLNAPANQRRIRVGLALGGGGMRGAAHVGVLKVLLEEGIPIDLIAGTSIGAAVGGFYCAGVPLDKLAEQFNEAIFIKEFMPMPLTVRLVLAPIIFIPRLFGYHPYDGLYKGEHCRKYADRLIGKVNCNMANLSIPYAAVCTNLIDGKSYRLSTGCLGLAMQASTSVPGIKKPVPLDDRLYCDGGLSCNIPVSHVREMGADFVIAVNIDETLDQVPLNTFRAAGSVSRRILRIELANSDILACQQADFVIHPNTDGIGLISRKKSDGRKGIEAGIKAAREAMPELKRKLAAAGVQLTIAELPTKQ